MLELWTWYKKVMKDDVASAYVLRPLGLLLSQFTRGWMRWTKADERETDLVENRSQYLNWQNT